MMPTDVRRPHTDGRLRHEWRRTLAIRLARNGAIVGGLVAGAVGIGAAGYHYFDELSWLDAAVNAAMILTGMGPVSPLVTTNAKVFAIVYALFSGVFFLSMVAVLLAPALRHFLHHFHLELDERRARAIRAHGPTAVRSPETVDQGDTGRLT